MARMGQNEAFRGERGLWRNGMLWWFQVLTTFLVRVRGDLARRLDQKSALRPLSGSGIDDAAAVAPSAAVARYGFGWTPRVAFDLAVHVRQSTNDTDSVERLAARAVADVDGRELTFATRDGERERARALHPDVVSWFPWRARRAAVAHARTTVDARERRLAASEQKERNFSAGARTEEELT